jgi:cbb3-type cytochrome oxidase subunit 3
MSAGLWTLFSMGAFIAIVIWVFLIKSRKDFDAQAKMPLNDDARELREQEKKEDS